MCGGGGGGGAWRKQSTTPPLVETSRDKTNGFTVLSYSCQPRKFKHLVQNEHNPLALYTFPMVAHHISDVLPKSAGNPSGKIKLSMKKYEVVAALDLKKKKLENRVNSTTMRVSG